MKTLLQKILLVSLLVILLPVALAFIWTSGTLSALVEHRVREMAAARANALKLLLEEKKEIATGVVSWLAEVPALQKRLDEKDRRVIFQMLSPLLGALDIDLIEVMDSDGRIFLRVQDPFHYGDRPPLTPYVRGLLNGIRDLPGYGLEQRGDRLYLTAAESIQGVGDPGIVTAGYTVNADFIERLEQEVGGRIVLQIGDRAYSTCERHPCAHDAGGGMGPFETFEGFPEHRWKWHRSAGATNLGVRFPLSTPRGTEGTLSLYLPAGGMDASISALHKSLFIVALVGSALAFLASWYLSRRLTKPLQELVSATDRVAAGNFDGTIKSHSNDEIGSLACSFNHMLKELRRSEAEVDRYRTELERKFTERSTQLAETEDKRAAMAHMIAHDLKNPLLGIKKTLERLNQVPPEGRHPHDLRILDDLRNTSDLLIGMVNEMLDLYRSESSELHLAITRFEVREAVENCLRVLAFELEEKEIHIETRVKPADVSLSADKRRVTRLLINLISNAIRFSPQHGKLRVSAELVDGDTWQPELRLCVEDEGPGIAGDQLPAIFDRFYSRSHGTMGSGIGLGLPYCKLVAESHGGKIVARNRTEGGLSVLVTLPPHTRQNQSEKDSSGDSAAARVAV